MNDEQVLKQVLDCAFRVHTALGPGLLESAYEECLCYEMNQSGLMVQRQLAVPLVYKEVKLDAGFRLDILVNDCVIVELKSVECLTDIHLAQILTYMNLKGIKLGLLANFNVRHLKDGIKRVIC